MLNDESQVVDSAELQKPNNLKETLEEWWNSPEYKEMEKANEEDKQRAICKYNMLPEWEKLDMVQAICYIICKAEKSGTSHRGLMNTLGIYPSGFWISELMDVHNSLYTFYDEKRQKKELKDDLDTFENFVKDKTKDT